MLGYTAVVVSATLGMVLGLRLWLHTAIALRRIGCLIWVTSAASATIGIVGVAYGELWFWR